MVDTAVRIEKLSHSFSTNKVLDDIDMTVAPGEVVVLIGASGSGKTTLLRCINLLEIPQKGRIFVNDQPMGIHGEDGSFAPFSDSLLNRKRADIGMVFQRLVRCSPDGCRNRMPMNWQRSSSAR
jgi:polar amino acid transport system ATP-binding protein